MCAAEKGWYKKAVRKAVALWDKEGEEFLCWDSSKSDIFGERDSFRAVQVSIKMPQYASVLTLFGIVGMMVPCVQGLGLRGNHLCSDGTLLRTPAIPYKEGSADRLLAIELRRLRGGVSMSEMRQRATEVPHANMVEVDGKFEVNGDLAVFTLCGEEHEMLVADLDMPLINGESATALQMAAAEGNTITAAGLLKAGATADLPNDDGDTAVHLAAYNGRVACLQVCPCILLFSFPCDILVPSLLDTRQSKH